MTGVEPSKLDPHQARTEPADQRWWYVLAMMAALYVFLLSIELLGGTFKLMGKGFAEALVQSTSNPFSGLLIGVLATSLVQSSSTTTSLVVGLVGSGALPLEMGVPVIMGANIGTSITNTIVSLGHLTRAQEFQRAFAGATVHDFFNVMAVAVFLPLQIATGFLSKSAQWAQELLLGQQGVSFQSPVKAIVKPVSKMIQEGVSGVVDAKAVMATILIALALVMLVASLHYLVKFMKRLLLGQIETVVHRFVFQRPFMGIFLGALVTVAVQSSSVTTSLTVPLLAAGFVTIEQIFPFVLGANVGTTVTALMASMVTGSPAAVTLALSHLFFNIFGIAMFYPLRALPIGAAMWLGRMTLRSKYYALGYVLVVFFAVPGLLIFLTQ